MQVCSFSLKKDQSMKKSMPGLVLLFLIVIFSGCKPEKKAAEARKPPERRETQPTEESLSAGECRSLMSRLDSAIRRVNERDDMVSKKRLAAASWDSVAGSFICMGKGVVNPKLPPAAQSEAQKKAAQLTAERWALYLRKWRDGEYISPAQGISGEITYSRKLCGRSDGDTLFLLLQVPLGSIVVEQAVQ